MFCAGRVPEEDLKRTMKACGGSIQTTAAQLTDDVLGLCENFEEEQIGGERSVCRANCDACPVWWNLLQHSDRYFDHAVFADDDAFSFVCQSKNFLIH